MLRGNVLAGNAQPFPIRTERNIPNGQGTSSQHPWWLRRLPQVKEIDCAIFRGGGKGIAGGSDGSDRFGVLFECLWFGRFLVDVEFTDQLVCAGGDEELAVGGVGEFCFACDVGIRWDDPGRNCCRGHPRNN